MDISYNRFSGELPKLPVNSTRVLQVFDLSYNEFTGIPVYYKAKYTSIVGNRLTHGYGLYESNEQLIIEQIFLTKPPWDPTNVTLLEFDHPIIFSVEGDLVIPRQAELFAPNPYLYPQDRNECNSSLTPNPCQLNAICSDGWRPRMSFTCECMIGYELDEETGLCVDINECLTGEWQSKPSHTNSLPCSARTQCFNLNGTFDCCPKGTQNLDPVFGSSCVDINECINGEWETKTSSNGVLCVNEDRCVNTNGGFFCCERGFRNPNLMNGTKCEDINECVTNEWALGTGACASRFQCVNTEGSFRCCDSHFENTNPVNGTVCMDKNECLNGDWAKNLSSNTNAPCESVTKCLNKNGSFECCLPGFENRNAFDASSCVDINECTDVDDACWSIHACNNLPGSWECCDPGFVSDEEGNCVSCFTEWTPFKPTAASEKYPSLARFSPLFYYFDSCLGPCDNAQIVLNRSPRTSECNEQYTAEVTTVDSCQYACNYSFKTNVETTVGILSREFRRGDFLNQIIKSIFGQNITWTGKKRSSGFSFSMESCVNATDVKDLIQGLAKDILPNSTDIDVLLLPDPQTGACVTEVTATDNSYLGYAIGIPVGVVVLIIVILIILWLTHRSHSTDWLDLPPILTASFQKFERSSRGWTYRGSKTSGYYFQSVDQNANDIQQLLRFFEAESLPIKEIYALYNRTLIDNFLGSYRLMTQRIIDSPLIFNKQAWKKQTDELDARQLVYDAYQHRIQTFSKDSHSIPLLPCVHGTHGAVCEKIAETGFANLSRIDDGYYGKGIYFSTKAPYVETYVRSSREPALLISWVLPGNTYPVIEHPRKPDNLVGSALKSGYNSHYCIVAKDGFPTTPSVDFFDEIVIPQEGQILPAFIVFLDRTTGQSVTTLRERTQR